LLKLKIEKELPKISEKNDKFEFTGETITLDYRTLYRIRAKRDQRVDKLERSDAKKAIRH